MNSIARLRDSRIGVIAGTLMLALAAGCAAPAGGGSSSAPAASAALITSAPLISVPSTSVGTWYDLGNELSPWMGGEGPVPIAGANAPTRAVGLQRGDGSWVAVVVVQSAPASAAPACPQTDSLHVGGRGPSDCLRLRRDADLEGWLKVQHSVLWEWLEDRGLATRPRSWVGHRFEVGGRMLEVHALFNPSLIEPVTRNNSDFLAGGHPGTQWAQALANSTRAAAGGATLVVPPFPYAVRMAPPPPPPKSAVTTTITPPPTRATQVPQPATQVLTPRRDRE
ncbi:hypothetical protein [Ottowia thiooxydans]|uniref:hypothetical protein n=1 Tax=Ottowia thiooxydans TaxID=219182 RepID=UPI00048AA9D8|nr:hypothetical protein [Ottowia thiooxydans]